jgi:hypothetical protein
MYVKKGCALLARSFIRSFGQGERKEKKFQENKSRLVIGIIIYWRVPNGKIADWSVGRLDGWCGWCIFV